MRRRAASGGTYLISRPRSTVVTVRPPRIRKALAYDHCERIIEDVGVFVDRLLSLRGDDGPKRRLILGNFAQALQPNDVIEIAERTLAAL